MHWSGCSWLLTGWPSHELTAPYTQRCNIAYACIVLSGTFSGPRFKCLQIHMYTRSAGSSVNDSAAEHCPVMTRTSSH